MPIQFDSEQLAAIRVFKGAYRVDACAGSGKTSTLIGRLNFLKAGGVPESDILALTFTKNAAEEMRLRAKAGKETLRTLHSWALAAVKEEINEFSPRLRSFPLLTAPYEIIVPLSKQYSVQYKDLAGYISSAKRYGKTPQQMLGDSETEQQREMARAYEQYQAACRRQGVFDFDSIIWELVLLLERKPEVAARHQIKFLMVDEAQDCSEMDWKLIRAITREHGNVFAVGDVGQSCYSFRGASPATFVNFTSMYPEAAILPLGTNYRSVSSIVEYSKLIMPEKTAYIDNWKAHKPGGAAPEFHLFANDVDEARWVLDQVSSGRCSLSETAIIARTNAQLAMMQGFCAERQIAYKLLGKDNFWKRPEVLGLLGLAKNVIGFDDASLKHALKSPLPCVRFLKKDDVIAALENAQNSSVGTVSFKDLLTHIDTGNHRQNEILYDVHSILRTTPQSTPYTTMLSLAEKSGALELGNEDEDHETFVKDNIQKIVNLSKSFITLKDFIRFVHVAGKPSRKQTRLVLSTVHGFKGLEAKNVFVIGVNLGVFPHDRAELQEEKRLYYVAVSRPTDNLFVSASGSPSEFIAEKVQETLEYNPDDLWENFQLQG